MHRTLYKEIARALECGDAVMSACQLISDCLKYPTLEEIAAIEHAIDNMTRELKHAASRLKDASTHVADVKAGLADHQ